MSPKWEFWREEYLLSVQQANMMDFDYCEEYIKQNIIMVVLRKANSHSVVIFTLIKQSVIKKMIQRKKLIQALIFAKLPSAYEVLTRKNVM